MNARAQFGIGGTVVVLLVGGCTAASPSRETAASIMESPLQPAASVPTGRAPAPQLRRVAVATVSISDELLDPWVVRVQPGELEKGELLWVLDTALIDEREWHLVAVDRLTDDFSMPFGWVPTSAEGSATLESLDLECPNSPISVDQLTTTMGQFGGLACYGGASVEVTGFTPLGCGIGGSPRVGSPEWLNGTWTGVHIGSRQPRAPNVGVDHSLNARLLPDSTFAPCAAPGWYRFSGHFDDPASATCRSVMTGPPDVVLDPRHSELLCRARFVIEETFARPDAP